MSAEEAKRRDRYYRQFFGITLKEYEELLQKQEGKCACCKRHHSSFKIRLCVDHNHKSGEIRGLLCTHCNRYIIGRHQTPDLLRNAADYLTPPYTGKYVPVEYIKGRPKRRRKKK